MPLLSSLCDHQDNFWFHCRCNPKLAWQASSWTTRRKHVSSDQLTETCSQNQNQNRTRIEPEQNQNQNRTRTRTEPEQNQDQVWHTNFVWEKLSGARSGTWKRTKSRRNNLTFPVIPPTSLPFFVKSGVVNKYERIDHWLTIFKNFG